MPRWFDLAVRQIECERKAGTKFGNLKPRLMLNPISVEQSTSAAVASLHALLIRKVLGSDAINTAVDMTCGMGMDMLALRREFDCHVTGFELNPLVAQAGEWNYKDDQFISVRNEDSVEWLKSYTGEAIDLIFIDPARRDDDGSRVYAISQCQPDVTALLPDLRLHCRFCAVKLSPMLDVMMTINSLPEISHLYVIGNGKECVELFGILDFTRPSAGSQPGEECMITVIPDAGKYPAGCYTFTRGEERSLSLPLSEPSEGQWLFEPSASTMKAAPFASLCHRFNMQALHPNTHLFVCGTWDDAAPGRWMRIKKIYPFSASLLKKIGQEIGSADVAVRNFPMKAEELATRLKVKPGGTQRLIAATTLSNRRVLILCQR